MTPDLLKIGLFIADCPNFQKYDGVHCSKTFRLETLQGLICIYFRLDPPQGQTGFAIRRVNDARPVWGNAPPVTVFSAAVGGAGGSVYPNIVQPVQNSHSQLSAVATAIHCGSSVGT